MGSSLEFNDTLKLERGKGFPLDLILGNEYQFERPGKRIFHTPPTRIFLVEEIEGKWNFRAQVHVIKQTIDSRKDNTSGIFKVIKIYPDDIRKVLNQFEAPQGKSYLF